MSDRDTDNTDRPDNTITHAGVDSGWESVSGLAWQSEMARASGCRLELERGLAMDSAPDWGLAQESASALDSATDLETGSDSGLALVDLVQPA